MSEVLDRLIASPNPDYKVAEIVNVLPFEVEAEAIGRTAIRLYMREQRRVFVVTISDYRATTIILKLAAAITAAGAIDTEREKEEQDHERQAL